MTVKGRMKGILEKQTAADRAREAEEARLAVVEKDAAALRSRVEQKWVELSAVLTETIMSANNARPIPRYLWSGVLTQPRHG